MFLAIDDNATVGPQEASIVSPGGPICSHVHMIRVLLNEQIVEIVWLLGVVGLVAATIQLDGTAHVGLA